MEKLKKTLTGLLCCLALTVPAAVLLFPYTPSAQQEEAQLTPMPAVTAESVITGSWFQDFSGYLSDHVPLREFWLKLQTKVTLLLQKKEINSVYVLEDRLIQRLSPPKAGVTEASAASVRKYAEEFNGRTFFMLVPTAEEICSDKLPPVQAFSQQQLIRDFYTELSLNGITGIDGYSPLSGASNQYLYCRTDTRWTSLGAYYGYSAVARAMGLSPVTTDRMNIEHVSHGYLGGLYWQTGVTGITPDTIDIYTYSGYNPKVRLTLYTSTGKETYRSLYFRDFLSTEDGYSVFLGEDVPMAVINTDNAAGESLLLFGDGLCDNMIPFLALHYSRITVIDLGISGFNYKDYIDGNDYDTTLFCYGVDSFIKGGQIGKVNLPATNTERGTVE